MAFSLRLIQQRWKMIGYPKEEMPVDLWPFDPARSMEEVAADQIKLMLAGVTGEPCTSPDSSVEIQTLHFDTMARIANSKAIGAGRFTVEWRFNDADTWHITIQNGNSTATQGAAPNPDLTLKTTWAEWISIAMDQKNPMRSVTSRKLTPWGSPRALNAFRKAFAPAPV